MEQDAAWHQAVLDRLETLYREVGELMHELYEHPIGSTTYYLSGAESSIAHARDEVEQEMKG